MKEKDYELILTSNGDILITCSVNGIFNGAVVYCHSYNPNENLQDNLINAFKEYENLKEKEMKKNGRKQR